jgi:hypothetical protein
MWNLFDDVLEVYSPAARENNNNSEDKTNVGKGKAKVKYLEDETEKKHLGKGKGKAKDSDDYAEDKEKNNRRDKGKGKAKAEDQQDDIFVTPRVRLPSWMATEPTSEGILSMFRPSAPENSNPIAGPSRAAEHRPVHEPPHNLSPPRSLSSQRTFSPPHAFSTPRRTSTASDTLPPRAGPSTPHRHRGRDENLAALESRLARDASNHSLDDALRTPSRRASGLRSTLASAMAGGGSPSRAGRRVRSALGQLTGSPRRVGRAASASAASLLGGAVGALGGEGGGRRSRAGSGAGEERGIDEEMAVEVPAKAAKLLGLQEKKGK